MLLAHGPSTAHAAIAVMMRHTRQVPPCTGQTHCPHSSLRPAQVTAVFNYARNLLDKYLVGRVIGAGSFGVVRECVERSSQRTYAVKTVPKASLHACAFPWIRAHARAHLHIMAADMIMARGLAMSLPAMSGAEPCTCAHSMRSRSEKEQATFEITPRHATPRQRGCCCDQDQ